MDVSKIKELAAEYTKSFVFEKNSKEYIYLNNIYSENKKKMFFILFDEILKGKESFYLVFVKTKKRGNNLFLSEFLINEYKQGFDSEFLFKLKKIILKDGTEFSKIGEYIEYLKKLRTEVCKKVIKEDIKDIKKLFLLYQKCELRYLKNNRHIKQLYLLSMHSVFLKKNGEIFLDEVKTSIYPLKNMNFSKLKKIINYNYRYMISPDIEKLKKTEQSFIKTYKRLTKSKNKNLRILNNQKYERKI